eukprot:CAMPEP_0206149408 /NCGR_PEP_ID=MMETSP1473-20131121/37765_1 /ASSEMBLY_ACC=CAM_ASM_001109 /TAXON_ID=1461547 /ORGANISM="Stichococcus sp, Strain RCC1054" /LENGTH=64 /DNA_ID=CAMNT_0053546869 /DNA_START=1855 /DNA_END=2045 /DNA_ORIENTATION=+
MTAADPVRGRRRVLMMRHAADASMGCNGALATERRVSMPRLALRHLSLCKRWNGYSPCCSVKAT